MAQKLTSKYYKSFTYILLFFSLTINSQEREKELIKEINGLLFNNPKEAKIKSHRLLRLVKGKKLLQIESNAYFFLAELSGTFSEKDSCLYYYDKAIQKANEVGNNKLILMYKINKANYLFNEYDFEYSIELYDEALKLAVKSNEYLSIDYINLKKGNLFLETNKTEDAVKIFKIYLNKSFDNPTLLNLYLNLSKSYLKKEDIDSSYYFLNKGKKIINGNKEFKIHFLNQESIILIKNKELNKSEAKLNDAIKIADEIDYLILKRLLLINLAKVKLLKNENQVSIDILTKILKNEEKNEIAKENLYEIYYLLAKNYKKINNSSLSNEYYELYIDESKKLGEKKISNINLLNKIEIKEIEIREQDEKNQKKSLIYLSVFLLLLIISISFYLIMKAKNEKVKFNLLLEKINAFEKANIGSNLFEEQIIKLNNNEEEDLQGEVELDEVELDEMQLDEMQLDEMQLDEEQQDESYIVQTLEENQSFQLKEETINEILEKLIKLEEKKEFLKQDFTLHKVAKKLKTNTAYLSKIVNAELNKSFSTYINELRINYIIIELKNNSKLRSYSVKAIGEEIGYKSPESFTKYFKNATGISPSAYIKRLNKL